MISIFFGMLVMFGLMVAVVGDGSLIKTFQFIFEGLWEMIVYLFR